MDKKLAFWVLGLLLGALALVAAINGDAGPLFMMPPAAALVWLVYRSQREQRAVQTQMRLELQSWLLQQFGLPFTEDAFGVRPPSASHVGTLKSHRVLRQQLQEMPPHEAHESYTLSATIILVDERGRYWLALYASTREAGANKPVVPSRTPHVERITELRARRALFNDPPAYQNAFGEPPTRAGLDAWRRQHPAQDRFERERNERD